MRHPISGALLAAGLTGSMLAGCGSSPEQQPLPTPATAKPLKCEINPQYKTPLLHDICTDIVKAGYEPYYPVVEFLMANVAVNEGQVPVGPVVNSKPVNVILLDSSQSTPPNTDQKFTPSEALGYYDRNTKNITVYNRDQLSPVLLQAVLLHEGEHAYHHSQEKYTPPVTNPTEAQLVEALEEELVTTSDSLAYLDKLYGQNLANFIHTYANSVYNSGGQLAPITQAQVEGVVGRKVDEKEFSFLVGNIKMASVFRAYDLTYGLGSQEAKNRKLIFLADPSGGNPK